MKKIQLLLFVFCFISSALSAEKLVTSQTPWLSNPGDTTFSVSFVMPSADTRTFAVEYRNILDDGAWSKQSAEPAELEGNKIFQANLKELKPGNSYEYRIIASDGAVTENRIFKTLDSTRKQHKVFFNSDIHHRSSMLKFMMGKGVKANCDLFVLLGDQIGNRMDPNSFVAIFDGFLTDAAKAADGRWPIVAVRGNHECRGRGTSTDNWFKVFRDSDGGDRTWQSFRIGPVWYMVLDSADFDSDYQADKVYPRQKEWIAKELETEACKTATFRVVLVHISNSCIDEKIMDLVWNKMGVELLQSTDPAKRIHLMVSGHRHRYVRSDAGSTLFKVNSSSFGDNPSGRPNKDLPYTSVLLDARGNGGVEYCYAIMEATAESLVFQAFDGQTLKPIDHFSVTPDGKVKDLMDVPSFEN